MIGSLHSCGLKLSKVFNSILKKRLTGDVEVIINGESWNVVEVNSSGNIKTITLSNGSYSFDFIETKCKNNSQRWSTQYSLNNDCLYRTIPPIMANDIYYEKTIVNSI